MHRLRFEVGVLSGFQGTKRKATWYMHDMAYCGRVVKTFRHEQYAKLCCRAMNVLEEIRHFRG